MSETAVETPVIVIDAVEDESSSDLQATNTQTTISIDVTSTGVTHGNNSPAASGTTDTSKHVQKSTLSVPPLNTSIHATSDVASASTSPEHNGPATERRRHSSKDEDLKHLCEESLLLAQTLIKDAESGRNFVYKTDPAYVRYYIFYHRWYFRWTLYFCIALNMALALFEAPTREGWLIPYWASMLLEVFCLAFFIARVIHALQFSLPSVFWKDTKNIMVIGIIVLTLLDMVCYVLWVNLAPDKHPVRWSRPLRSLLIINFSDGRQVRRAFRNIRRTVPAIVNVLILFLMSVLLFALLALKLFGRRKSLTYPNGRAYFKNYLDSIWDLYVLVTTANNPDVMMPAYDESKWFAIYFVIYLIICLYVFMSIVLAAIYNNFRQNLKNEIREAVFGKRRKLRQAFAILKVERNGQDVMTKHIWTTIISRVLPSKSIDQIELLMTILDRDAKGYISKRDFLNLVNLLQVPVTEVHDRQTYIEKKFPDMYRSKISRVVRVCVRHKFFRIFFDFMIFLNAWFIGFDVDAADWFFLGIFLLEILLKLYVFGPKEFFLRLWNIFDFFVIIGAVIATAVESVSGEVGEELSTLDLLLVLRVMRLVKIFVSIKRFKVILMTILNIGPSIITYGGVIFVLYYIFAIIGMEVFHGLISFHGYNETKQTDMFCGNPDLKGSNFYRNHYCNNNFNDILKSFVVLFELTVVNQWHVLSSGFVYVTNKWARLYFITFHMFCVIIVLNIFVAFILEAFILEYSLQKTGRLESEVESKIKELGLGIGQTLKKDGPPDVDMIELVSNEIEVDRTPPATRNNSATNVMMEDSDVSDTESIPDISNERGVRFHLKKKSRKKVEVLLQQMFEGEINPDDEDEESYLFKKRTLTLDEVT